MARLPCIWRCARWAWPGDEVIVPSNTYIATWLAVSQCGATPVPVEPDARTYNIDPSRIEQVVTPATRLTMPVHSFGQRVESEPDQLSI